MCLEGKLENFRISLEFAFLKSVISISHMVYNCIPSSASFSISFLLKFYSHWKKLYENLEQNYIKGHQSNNLSCFLNETLHFWRNAAKICWVSAGSQILNFMGPFSSPIMFMKTPKACFGLLGYINCDNPWLNYLKTTFLLTSVISWKNLKMSSFREEI